MRRNAARTGKPIVGLSNIAFVTKVIHPGLVARPLFPPAEQLLSRLADAGKAYLARKLERT